MPLDGCLNSKLSPSLSASAAVKWLELGSQLLLCGEEKQHRGAGFEKQTLFQVSNQCLGKIQ